MNIDEDSLAPRSSFDLNFRLGAVPVRVHPYFWLSTFFLGLNLDRSGMDIVIYLLVWAAMVFVSVLVHEMGHILMGSYFGNQGHIILTGFCGLAVGSSDLPERGQRIAVSLAGPGAGFLLAAVVAGLSGLYNPDVTLFILGSLFHVHVQVGPNAVIPSALVLYIIYNMLWINIFWGLVNLLPIWPLDGGKICREACQAYRGRDGLRLSLQVSLLTAGGLAILALIEMATKNPLVPFLAFGGTLFPVVFFGILAFSSWQVLQAIKRAGRDWEEQENEPRDPWERDADWWKRGDNSWRE